MAGVFWTAGIIGAALFAARHYGYLRPLRREYAAIILLTLGTHSIVVRTANEILDEPVALETALRGILAGIAGLIIIAPLGKRLATWGPTRFRGLAAYTAYVGIAALSVIFSVAKVSTAAKAFELSVGVAIVWLLAREGAGAIRKAILFLVFLDASLLIAALVGFFVLPSEFSFAGSRPGFLIPVTLASPYAHSNGLAATGGFTSAFAIAKILSSNDRAERWKYGALATAATLALLLASGRQGVVIWIVAIGLLLWLYRRRLFLLLVGPAFLALVATNWDTVSYAFTRGGRIEQTLSLTGRIGWWTAALEAWKVHPITGYGFGVGGRFAALAQLQQSGTTPGVHGGYVETLVGLGILGMLPLLYCMWRVGAWSANRLLNRRPPALPIMTVPIFLHTIVSRGFGGWLNSDVMIFVALLALADISSRDSSKRSHYWTRHLGG